MTRNGTIELNNPLMRNMIEFKQGNLLEEKTEAIVNTVNCVGVMGKGIALQFKQAFPENFKLYKKACDTKELQPGMMLTFFTGDLLNPRYIINFPTKRHWKGKSRIEDVQSGLDALLEEIRRLDIRSIAIPPLGCGNGGLNWDVVKPLIVNSFTSLPDIQALIFEPSGAPVADQMVVSTEKPGMTRARALFIKLLELYGIQGYRLSRLEIQKLAYFLQEAGEPLRLGYVKHQFGPYANNLNHVLQKIEGHFIRGCGDLSQESQIYVLPEGRNAAQDFLQDDNEAQARLARVSDLIIGYETPYGMEMLATVHWVVKESPEAAMNSERAIALVHEWNPRKRDIFKPQHLRKAWERLYNQGWFDLLI